MKDLYSVVTDRIIEQLKQGIIPWRRPWTGVMSGAISHVSGRAYSLINQLVLSRPGEYLTWNQVKAEGGHVRKGAKAREIIFWKIMKREQRDASGAVVTDADGFPVPESIPVLKYFQVFHIDDCEGIKPRFPVDALKPADPIPAAEAAFSDYLNRSGVKLVSSISDNAFYRPATDTIHLPIIEQFDALADYYGTAFHEATHSTGHKSRLNRLDNSAAARFGSEIYSKEELTAEIGSACILHYLGIETPETVRNNAAYVQSWLEALNNDKRFIISAAARAEKAVKLILNLNDEKGEAAGE